MRHTIPFTYKASRRPHLPLFIFVLLLGLGTACSSKESPQSATSPSTTPETRSAFAETPPAAGAPPPTENTQANSPVESLVNNDQEEGDPLAALEQQGTSTGSTASFTTRKKTANNAQVNAAVEASMDRFAISGGAAGGEVEAVPMPMMSTVVSYDKLHVLFYLEDICRLQRYMGYPKAAFTSPHADSDEIRGYDMRGLDYPVVRSTFIGWMYSNFDNPTYMQHEVIPDKVNSIDCPEAVAGNRALYEAVFSLQFDRSPSGRNDGKLGLKVEPAVEQLVRVRKFWLLRWDEATAKDIQQLRAEQIVLQNGEMRTYLTSLQQALQVDDQARATSALRKVIAIQDDLLEDGELQQEIIDACHAYPEEKRSAALSAEIGKLARPTYAAMRTGEMIPANDKEKIMPLLSNRPLSEGHRQLMQTVVGQLTKCRTSLNQNLGQIQELRQRQSAHLSNADQQFLRAFMADVAAKIAHLQAQEQTLNGLLKKTTAALTYTSFGILPELVSSSEVNMRWQNAFQSVWDTYEPLRQHYLQLVLSREQEWLTQG